MQLYCLGQLNEQGVRVLNPLAQGRGQELLGFIGGRGIVIEPPPPHT